MALVNLVISPMQGYIAAERVEAISAELWAISRPHEVRQPEDTAYLFGWITHPQTGVCVLQAYTDYIIKVHPQKDLTNLIALFPDLSQQEKDGLSAYIQNSQSFPFGNIIPSNSATITDEQMEADGWFNPATP